MGLIRKRHLNKLKKSAANLYEKLATYEMDALFVLKGPQQTQQQAQTQTQQANPNPNLYINNLQAKIKILRDGRKNVLDELARIEILEYY